jgi:hypothetical protein
VGRPDDKVAALLWLFQELIPASQPTVVFAATKHHVDFLATLLQREGVRASGVYGSMDQVLPHLLPSRCSGQGKCSGERGEGGGLGAVWGGGVGGVKGKGDNGSREGWWGRKVIE